MIAFTSLQFEKFVFKILRQEGTKSNFFHIIRLVVVLSIGIYLHEKKFYLYAYLI